MFEVLGIDRYLRCIRNFVTILHKNLLSNNFTHKESFWMLTSDVLIINNTEGMYI